MWGRDGDIGTSGRGDVAPRTRGDTTSGARGRYKQTAPVFYNGNSNENVTGQEV